MAPREGMKRYHLEIQETLYKQVEDIAIENGITVVQVLRRFIKIGLMGIEAQKTPGGGLIVRDENGDRMMYLP
jgi:hypothetical protein